MTKYLIGFAVGWFILCPVLYWLHRQIEKLEKDYQELAERYEDMYDR